MAEHWNGGSGGKGSKPRPYAVTKDEFDQKFDTIFGKKESKYCSKCGKTHSWCQCDNTGTDKNEYYDTLSTEDCLIESDDKITRYNEETQQVLGVKKYITEI